MLTLSLGATNFGPPKTCRGTKLKPATAVAVLAMNLRRVNPGAGAFFFWLCSALLWVFINASRAGLRRIGGCQNYKGKSASWFGFGERRDRLKTIPEISNLSLRKCRGQIPWDTSPAVAPHLSGLHHAHTAVRIGNSN